MQGLANVFVIQVTRVIQVYVKYKVQQLVVPTPLVGGGTICSNGFFCSDNFGRSKYSSQRNVSGIIKKLIQRRIQKRFF